MAMTHLADMTNVNHAGLFKRNKFRGSWKEQIRKRCRERLSLNRENYLSKMRWPLEENDLPEMLSKVVMDEVVGLQNELVQETAEPSHSNSCTTHSSAKKESQSEACSTSDEIEEAMKIMKEIQEELLEEVLAEYHRYQDAEMEDLAMKVEKLEAGEVICLLCQKKACQLLSDRLTCSCGMQLLVPDGFTLQDVRRTIDELVFIHDQQCDSSCKFGISESLSLLIYCHICTFEIITPFRAVKEL